MGEKKVTTMVLKVDLNCEKCRKKVKKILCKIPQIQDQVWDEKNNTVTIKVVCCSPEKIREKILCKGCGSIKCIEIVVLEKPDKPDKPNTHQEPEPLAINFHNHVSLAINYHPCQPCPAPPPCKPCPAPPTCKPCPAPPPCEPCAAPPPCEPCPAPPPCEPCPAPPPCKPCPAPPPCEPCPASTQTPCRSVCCSECCKGVSGGPCFHRHGGGPPPCQVNPIGVCCSDCYNGVPGGPCFYGNSCGPPTLCYQYDSYGGGRGFSGCGNYLSEENPQGCSVM